MLTLTIAGPVRTYFGQRTEMKQLEATEEQLRAQIAELEQQKVKLADPVFIAAQARERLGFVMPGEIPYQVQLPAGSAVPGRPASSRRPSIPTSRGTPRCGTPSPMRRTAFRPHRRPARRAPLPPPAPPRRARSRWLTAPTSTPSRGNWAVNHAASWRSRTGAPTGSPAWSRRRRRLPDGTPFPTLYYLTHPALTAAASRLESSGLMREMTERLQQRPGTGRRVPPGARVAISPSVMR